MARLVKKPILVAMIITTIMMLTACSSKWGITQKDKKIMADRSEECVKAFIDKDAERLVDMFCSYVVENRKDLTVKETQRAIDFIDGNITSYESESTGIEQEHSTGNGIVYYSRSMNYRLYTDKDKQYAFSIEYDYIWKKHKDYEGITSIHITDKDSHKSVDICDFSYPYDDQW